MCYIYKFWWNSVSKYIGLYLAITSYSTRFNISHSLCHTTTISSRTFAINWQVAYIVSGMYKNEPLVPWKQDEPHIYTRWWLCLYLWLYASEIDYRTSKRTFFFARDLYQKRKRFGLLMKDGLSKTVPWSICSRRRKESVFLGHLKKRNIYAFYKVSTDRFHTRGQQLWFFFSEQKKVLQKKRVQSPRDFFWLCTWPLWDLCENDPYSNHCL